MRAKMLGLNFGILGAAEDAQGWWVEEAGTLRGTMEALRGRVKATGLERRD
jgi:hypothetical protein